jgi:hypothetical protein
LCGIGTRRDTLDKAVVGDARRQHAMQCGDEPPVLRIERRLVVDGTGVAQHLILHDEKDQRLPGRHITDCQTRLYMKSRQTKAPAIAAAKAGLSTATAYRIEYCATIWMRTARQSG